MTVWLGPKRRVNIVRRKLADGTIKEYRYERGAAVAPPPRHAPESVGALLAAYRRSPEWAALADATKRFYAIYLREVEALADRPAKDIGRRLLLDMRDAIATYRGNGAATAFIRVTAALFSWALERGWIEHDPLHKVRSLPSGHLETWTTVVLARWTGQRRGDLCRMTWSAVDAGAQTITLTQQKTGAKIVLPVHPTLAAELAAWRADGTLFLLTTRQGLPWKPDQLTGALAHDLVKHGFRAALGIHGLRKYMATDLAHRGASTHEIAAVTGHRSLGMVALYTAAADQERLAGTAIARLQNADEKLILSMPCGLLNYSA